MQVTETLHDGLKRGWAVTVPVADIEGKRTAKLQEIGRTVRLPGFRPGKVPLNIVRQRYGSAVMSEVLQESVNTATQQVLTERGLRAANQPKVDVTQLADQQDLQFTVEVELLPEIAMPDFAGLHLTRLHAEPSPESIDKALVELANRTKKLVDVTEDRGAQTGDTLTVDYVGKVDGVPFEGGTGTAMPVELGAGSFIPGFTEGMEGMRPGEERQINVTFPAEYHSPVLAGKAATFDLKATALQHATPPVIDETLAEQFGFDTLEELRKLIAQQIQREYDGVSRMRIKRDLLDHLAEGGRLPGPAEHGGVRVRRYLEPHRGRPQGGQGRRRGRRQGRGDAADRVPRYRRTPGPPGTAAVGDRAAERRAGRPRRAAACHAGRGRQVPGPGGPGDGVLPQEPAGGRWPARPDLRG